MGIYYLGLKKKLVQNSHFFNKIIVLEGGDSNDICYESIYKKKLEYNDLKNFKAISKFYERMMKRVEKEDKDCRFMLYNQASIEFIKSTGRIVCLNDLKLVKMLNDKPKCREFLSKEINSLNYKYFKAKDITFKKMKEAFGDGFNKFVVQQPSGFAGFGTFLLDESDSVINKLDSKITYSVSGYVENSLSLNNTFLISDDYIHIFDGSFQNIKVGKELNYDGWDFDAYKSLSEKMQEKIEKSTIKIAKKLQKEGYRGIGGVDYIMKGDDLYFMEINPRFQSSSEYLDKLLVQKGLPSIFELNYMAFYNKTDLKKVLSKVKA